MTGGGVLSGTFENVVPRFGTLSLCQWTGQTDHLKNRPYAFESPNLMQNNGAQAGAIVHKIRFYSLDAINDHSLWRSLTIYLLADTYVCVLKRMGLVCFHAEWNEMFLMVTFHAREVEYPGKSSD